MTAGTAKKGQARARTARRANPFPDAWIAKRLPLPAADDHKYSRGKLVAFAGSRTYPGAALLAGDAALRTGAGYVHVVTERSVVPLVIAHRPSIVATSRKEWKWDAAPAQTAGRPCAYLVGPGFDASRPTTGKTLLQALEHAEAPVLVDGGALTALASEQALTLLGKRSSQGYGTVLTPHGGEAARLASALPSPNAAEEASDADLASALARAYHAIVVLKGPVTFVCDGERTYRMAKGTPALAKAGTGDVLAGMVGALLAQGIEPFEACVMGTRLHAQAGTEAAARLGAISVTAEDVIDMIPRACKALAARAPKPKRK